MKKRIVLLEDHPERVTPLARDLQRRYGVDIASVLCFNVSVDRIKMLQPRLAPDILYEGVDIWDFYEILDGYYRDGSVGFIFDRQLYPGKDIEIFDQRINVAYALPRRKDHRIWFYTLAGKFYENSIRNRFNGYVIEVKSVEGGIVLCEESCDTFVRWLKN